MDDQQQVMERPAEITGLEMGKLPEVIASIEVITLMGFVGTEKKADFKIKFGR